MIIDGVVLEDRQLTAKKDVRGFHKVDFVKKINKQNQALFNVETDEVYKEYIGQNNDFIFDFPNSQVINFYNPTFLEDTTLTITNDVEIDLTQNVVLDRVISDIAQDIILFVNGYACYSGLADGVTLTPFTSTVATSERNNGFLFIASSPDNINIMPLIVDRVKATFQVIGGGTKEVWFSLPIERELDPADVLYFDYYGACYNGKLFDSKAFLSSFTIFDAAKFNKGATVNELYFARGYGQQTTKFLNIQNAENYDLDYLGKDWFGVERREGESDKDYRRRIVSAVVGEKCTPYALRQILTKFSPFVIILEGLKGYGYYRRSFYSFQKELIGSGVYTGYVSPAYFGSIAGGLLNIRIIIESNSITEDPINARFIFELVQEAVLAGVTFQIQKV